MIGLPFGGRPSVSIVSSTPSTMFKGRAEDNYPLYNIERLDQDRFQISVALAGFSPDEISLLSGFHFGAKWIRMFWFEART
jgi:hypothetical protein